MSKLHDVRMQVRAELEAPAILRQFGSGWLSGVLGLALGAAGFLLVLSLRAPGQFSMPELRALHGSHWFRLGLHVLLLLAFGLSGLSLALRNQRTLGTIGVLLTLAAALLGGPKATSLAPDPTPLFLGLDWFVLNVLLTGILFIPVERLFPRRADQPVFREEWRGELFFFFFGSMMGEGVTFLTFAPPEKLLSLATLSQLPALGGAL